MPFEQIIAEIKAQEVIINNAQKVKADLIDRLQNADAENYDWVSVKKASEILDVSLGMIYKKIEAGKLEVKLIGSKKFVKKSAIMELNEKS